MRAFIYLFSGTFHDGLRAMVTNILRGAYARIQQPSEVLYCFVVFAPNKHILYNLVMHFAYTNLDNSDVYCDGQIILTKFLLISRRDKKINVKNIIDM